jgi:NADH:ubiquinone oxidoreductase subunit 4 (subunit M)
MYLYKEYGTTDYQTLLTAPRLPAGMVQNLVFLAFFASFAVKIPKFPFHI